MFKTIAVASAAGIFCFASLSISMAAPAEFEAKKQKKLTEIEERLTHLNEHKACVTAATDEKALQGCREKAKDFHQEQKLERMERRKGMMEKRMEHLKKDKDADKSKESDNQ